MVRVGTIQLCRRRERDKEIHGEEAVVLGYNHKRVAGPNESGGGQGGRLCDRELVSWPCQVTQTGNDEALRVKEEARESRLIAAGQCQIMREEVK